MEGHRFDGLVRNMAAPRSRRRLLLGVVATATAGLALRLSAGAVAGQVVTDADKTCSQDSDCKPAVPDPCTGAFCDAGSCTYASVACMRGHVCCGNGECCPEGEASALPGVTSGDSAAAGESDATQPEVTESSNSGCTTSHSRD